MTLGTGLPSWLSTRMLDGLRSRWMTPFWWACWTAEQTCTNRLQPVRDAQPVVVAELGERHALDQLHDEERAARRRWCRRRAPWRCSGGPSGRWPAARPRTGPGRLPTSIAGPDQLDRHPPPDRLGLVGHPDGAHPALADLLEQLVPAGDDRAPAAAAGGRPGRSVGGRSAGRRPAGRGSCRPAAWARSRASTSADGRESARSAR